MGRSRLLVPAVVAGLAVAVGVALASSGEQRADEDVLTRAELYRLQDRIDAQWDALAREGVYVLSTGQPGESCVAIGLANPTRPNIRYLQDRFGPHVCVRRKPAGLAQACSGYAAPNLRTGPITVPDVRDLGLEEASRRLLSNGLTFAIHCLGDVERKVKHSPRHSPDQLVRITKQCPRSGELVPAGSEVALEAKAILPGGFEFKQSALTRYNTGTTKPCADGRNPVPAEPRPR